MLHLDDATAATLLDLPSVTDAVASAFAAWGRGEAATTQRVRATSADGMASAMAAVVPPFTGGKVYATVDGRFTFVNVLFDLSGRLLCTLDGDVLTRFRTPACSAIAIRHLACPGARVAALLGAGHQAWTHLQMLDAELPLQEIRVYNRHPTPAAELVERASAVGISAHVATTPAEAVAGADVVVTLTRANQPLFTADALAPHALVCAVGATKHDRCEIGPDVVAACAAVVCDDVAGSRVECGDLIHAVRGGAFDWDQAIELHAVCAGTVEPHRAGPAPVLFETQGVALQDVAAAGVAWMRYSRAIPNRAEPKEEIA